MRLFIANTTKNIQAFAYRVPGNPKPIEQKIAPGTQERIYRDDANRDELESIIKQHQDCPLPWLIPIEEVDRHKGFIGLVYQFDKEIPQSKIERKFRENDQALIEKGVEIRKELSVATQEYMNRKAEELTGNNLDVGNIRTEVIEEIKLGEREDGKMAEGVHVAEESKRGRGRPRG